MPDRRRVSLRQRTTRRPKRVAIWGVGAASALVAVSTYAAPPAQASLSDCPTNNFCMYINTNFQTSQLARSARTGSFHPFTESRCAQGDWNDCPQSAANNFPSGVSNPEYGRMWVDTNFSGGSYYTLQAGSYATDLGPFNKKASSLDLFVIV